jgi:tRNA nucleotidyltransferase (CCA-adding enzyme)
LPDSLDRSLKSFLSPYQAQILQLAAAIAQGMDFRLYAVGGIVRDLLLESARRIFGGQDLQDLDLVVEQGTRAGIEVAIALHRHYPQARLQIHDKFQTAELIWSGEYNFTLDLATARLETYEYPGANPQVDPSSLKQDLSRRDFSINAMALQLFPNLAPSPLIDLFNGQQDLDLHLVRAIRPGSFAEDPRRIFRAVRFAVRFNLVIAPETKTEVEQTLATGLHDRIGGSRLRAEINYLLAPALLARETPLIWRSLYNLGALRCVYHPFYLAPSFESQWKRWQRWQSYFLDIQPSGNLEFLLADLPSSSICSLNLGLTALQQKRLNQIHELSAEISNFKDSKASEVVFFLEKFDLVTLLIYGSKTSDRVYRRLIWQYFQTWRKVKVPLTAQELIQLGCPPGKLIGQILQSLRGAVLDNQISDRLEAQELALKIISLS